MKEIYERFTTPQNLEQCRHGFTTQSNEAFNTSIATLAPKNKTYGTTMSLTNRVVIAIGVKNLGRVRFWERVYEKLQISIPKRFLSHLENLDRYFIAKQKKESTPAFKRKRSKRNNEKITAEVVKAKQSRNKEYGTGIGFDDRTAATTQPQLNHKQHKRLALFQDAAEKVM